jgi:hypothetical protein
MQIFVSARLRGLGKTAATAFRREPGLPRPEQAVLASPAGLAIGGSDQFDCGSVPYWKSCRWLRT